jgi:hypothetical protein
MWKSEAVQLIPLLYGVIVTKGISHLEQSLSMSRQIQG